MSSNLNALTELSRRVTKACREKGKSVGLDGAPLRKAKLPSVTWCGKAKKLS